MKRPIWPGILCCILSCALLAFAQSSNTTLRGVIRDPGGAVIPRAKITITDNAKGISLTTTSNAAGAYLFPQIPPAAYTIRVSFPGFGDSVKLAELLVNQPATIDFDLNIQTSTVTVDVSGVAQTLNTSDASIGNASGNAEIQALPSETRNVPDLLSLQPGALYLPSPGYGAGDSRSGAVNGGRSDQGNVTLDGVDDNDQVGGFAFTGVLRVTQDSIEEFRVVTANSNADAGRSSGAQVSMVTKSGSNKFHGALYEYHRPTFTVANDWFNKQAQTANGMHNVPGKLIRNIFGGDLGGAIKRDKLFVFGNYEGVRQAENVQTSRTAPTASYQAGQVVYPDANGNPVTITSGQMAQLDSACLVCNTSIYPYPAGDNPNSLAYFKSVPAANGTNRGDGFNTGSYTFSSPAPIHLNTSIVRLDYTASDRHRFLVRGNLQDDTTSYAEQFPGQPPAQTLADNSKGITAGHTWTISHDLINDLRYGYVRQGFGNYGVGKGEYVEFLSLDPPTAETRNRVVSVPVNNIVDNLSWKKSNHTLEFGANWRHIHQNNSTDANSFNSATTNPFWLGGSTPDPCQLDNYCAAGSKVPSGFGASYQKAFANMLGAVPQITNVFNYKITSPTGGSALAEGTSIQRHFSTNEFEWYAQDAWRVKPNFTLIFGIRHTILQTPWETSGQQVTPTIDTHKWYMQREAAAMSGQIYEEDLQFAPAGKFYNKPGYWPMNKDNFAPRLAIAYSPDTKTSLRAGFGLYYDHFGQALVNSYDQMGSFGMSSSVSNPGGYYSLEGTAPFCGTPGCAPQGAKPAAPRFVGRSTLPPISVGTAPLIVTYPFLYPQNNFSVQWGLDSKIKTPYSETFDLSVQRELRGGVSFEAAYVGRLGRHLLQQLDLAQPVDYVDPTGAGDYYAAASQLSRDVDLNGGNFGLNRDANGTPIGSRYIVAPIQYFENVFPFMAGYDYAGESATQAIYNNEWARYRSQLGATSPLSNIDFYCNYRCPAGWQPHFWQDQFSSLYALSSIGMSYYNGMQLILRHPISHGLLFDVSYTWSHSIDMGSDAERTNELTGSQSTNTASFSAILSTWKPYLNRASSDFDTRHLVTVDWVYALPLGRGKALAESANRLVDAFIGGWQWSGINRLSSSLPFSLIEPGWTTDWQIGSFGVVTAPVKIRKHYDQNHNPQFFDHPDAINAGVATGSPIRLPYPGEAGPRNNFRGDGYFDIDSGLTKTWKVRDIGAIHFEWEVYNVTNSVRFDVGIASLGRKLTEGNLGVSSATLSVPRRMQFALRFDF